MIITDFTLDVHPSSESALRELTYMKVCVNKAAFFLVNLNRIYFKLLFNNLYHQGTTIKLRNYENL